MEKNLISSDGLSLTERLERLGSVAQKALTRVHALEKAFLIYKEALMKEIKLRQKLEQRVKELEKLLEPDDGM